MLIGEYVLARQYLKSDTSKVANINFLRGNIAGAISSEVRIEENWQLGPPLEVERARRSRTLECSR
jgi:hypothetical protein